MSDEQDYKDYLEYQVYLAKTSNKEEVIAPIEKGTSPDNAIDESPLGILDRARLGWAKTPESQKQLLSKEYGADNIKQTGQGFVVKTNDKWHQVDPDFEWSFSPKSAVAGAIAGGAVAGGAGILAGGAAGALQGSILNTKNLKDLPGDIAQFAGQYGLKAAAVTRGAAMGGAAGSVAGPIGSFVGGVIGGVAGAVGEDALETGARYLGGGPGVPKNSEELQKQLYASMLFGAEQVVGGKVINKLGSGTVKALDASIEAMGATPYGKTVASKILSVISARPVGETRAIVENPKAFTPWMEKARTDVVNNTAKLDTEMRSIVNSTYDDLMGAKSTKWGEQYDAIEGVAKTLQYTPFEETKNLLRGLLQNGYTEGGRVVRDSADKITKKLAPGDQSAIRYVLGQAEKIAQREATGKPVAYQEMRNVIQGIDNMMYQHENGLTDGMLKGMLQQYRAQMKTHLTAKLQEKNPAVSKLYQDLNAKYGPAKEMLEDLSKYKDSERADAFINKVVKTDGSYKGEILKSLSDTLGVKDRTQDLLRARTAQNFAASGVWGGKKILGIPVGSPAGANAIAQGASSAKGAVDQFTGAIPYLDKGLNFMKTLSTENRTKMIQNPEFLQGFSNSLSGGTLLESDAKNQLLNSAGIPNE